MYFAQTFSRSQSHCISYYCSWRAFITHPIEGWLEDFKSCLWSNIRAWLTWGRCSASLWVNLGKILHFPFLKVVFNRCLRYTPTQDPRWLSNRKLRHREALSFHTQNLLQNFRVLALRGPSDWPWDQREQCSQFQYEEGEARHSCDAGKPKQPCHSPRQAAASSLPHPRAGTIITLRAEAERPGKGFFSSGSAN